MRGEGCRQDEGRRALQIIMIVSSSLFPLSLFGYVGSSCVFYVVRGQWVWSIVVE